MKIKGLSTVSTKKIDWLQKTFDLSVEQAKGLKKGKEIEVDNADALLQLGLVSVTEQKTKPKKAKPVALPTTHNIIAPDKGEEV